MSFSNDIFRWQTETDGAIEDATKIAIELVVERQIERVRKEYEEANGVREMCRAFFRFAIRIAPRSVVVGR